MASTFAWLDHDDAQRRRMLAVVELFKDEGTVDELGVGSVRDAIADILFPGTSVLHTRARYLLFIPWLLQRAASTPQPDNAVAELRRLEGILIRSLLAAGETDGVIGRQAKEKLKRMPSAAYWAALLRYGIRTADTTVEGYFRHAVAQRRSRGREPEADDASVLRDGRETALHADLPPSPDGLLRAATLALTVREADFLRERIQTSTKGSLLEWLLSHNSASDTDAVWQHPRYAEFPPNLRDVVDHGRRFSSAIHGAALLYNLLLAERRQSDALVERYHNMLSAWQEELGAVRPFDGWDRTVLWQLLREHGRPVSPGTRHFVDAWLDLVEARGDVEHNDAARRLVRDRELHLKGGRARLVNSSALEVWRGASGLVRLDYRWSVARTLIADVLSPASPEVT